MHAAMCRTLTPTRPQNIHAAMFLTLTRPRFLHAQISTANRKLPQPPEGSMYS